MARGYGNGTAYPYLHAGRKRLLRYSASNKILFLFLSLAVGLLFTGHSQCQTTADHEHEFTKLPTIAGLQSGSAKSMLSELTLANADQPTIDSAAVGDKFAGYELFVKLGCWVCHSTNPTSLEAPNSLSGASDYSDSFIRESIVSPKAYVRDGSTSLMPAFNDLSEKQIADLIAYIRAQFE